MAPPPPEDRAQLEFLQSVQRIFEEGEFAATCKFALLVALVELAIERGEDSGAPLELPIEAIAEKFIEQYWPHAAPYSAHPGAPIVLLQSTGRQAEVLGRIATLREQFPTLAAARADRRWPAFVKRIASVVSKMPLWKLQTLRRRQFTFLYEPAGEHRIRLLPGVAFNLRRFGALIRMLARSAWVEHVRSNPKNAGAVGSAGDLEAFLFGTTRGVLSAAAALLRELQENRCFYCEGAIKGEPHVDHFVPWSRYQRDLAHNFVLAHAACHKGDLPAGPGHLGRWVKRNGELGERIGGELGRAGFIDDLPATYQVARWAYRQAQDKPAQLWVRMKYTVDATRTHFSPGAGSAGAPRAPRSGGREQRPDGLPKRRQVILDDAPDDAVVHGRITVNQDVAKGDDRAVVRDGHRHLRVVFREAGQGLTDDAELPLDRGAQHLVREVLLEPLAAAEPIDPVRGELDVQEVLARLKPHRARSFPAPRAGGNRDWRGPAG